MNVKFYYNGVKINGKFYGLYYSKGSNIRGPDIITIFTKKYIKLPDIGWKVINNSDTLTDYFVKDKVELKPGDKWYDSVNKAWKLSEDRLLKSVG